MKVALSSYKDGVFEHHPANDRVDPLKSRLVLCFAGKSILERERLYEQLREKYPQADIVSCSTAGEIYQNTVCDNTASVTAVEFDNTEVRVVSTRNSEHPDSFSAGAALAGKIDFEGLAAMLVFSDGSNVNGSELVRGINDVVKNRVPVTGGLAGDGTAFESTLVGLNGPARAGNIIAIALYGSSLVVSHGSMGGWEIFGPERTVSRSKSNELFEIEGRNALDLYKTYLGHFAEELPGSALLFPLAVNLPDNNATVVRTILSIDQQAGSMTFAGDIPQGARVRFMKANFDKLIDAATGAARQILPGLVARPPRLAILISCVGRKIILGSRVEEEVEAVAEAFEGRTLMTGFYSYGEISPFTPATSCELHNQTMTITTFDEI
jgi:hypothetical protein